MKIDKNLLILIACLLLCVVFIVCIVPILEKVDVSLEGYIVSSNGSVQENITISVQGSQRNYLLVTDELIADIEIQFSSGSTLRAHTVGPYYQFENGVCVCSFSYEDGSGNSYDGGYLAYSSSHDRIMIEGLTGDIYYTASVGGTAEVADLLDFFSVLTARD